MRLEEVRGGRPPEPLTGVDCLEEGGSGCMLDPAREAEVRLRASTALRSAFICRLGERKIYILAGSPLKDARCLA